VWKARDTRLDRSVAIKILPAQFATISQLNHPHICTLYDVGDDYLVMELLRGRDARRSPGARRPSAGRRAQGTARRSRRRSTARIAETPCIAISSRAT